MNNELGKERCATCICKGRTAVILYGCMHVCIEWIAIVNCTSITYSYIAILNSLTELCDDIIMVLIVG